MTPTLLHPRGDLAAFAVTGSDRLAWLNGLVTQDVGKLANGSGAYGLAVGKTGRILAELWFIAASDRVFVVARLARMARASITWTRVSSDSGRRRKRISAT